LGLEFNPAIKYLDLNIYMGLLRLNKSYLFIIFLVIFVSLAIMALPVSAVTPPTLKSISPNISVFNQGIMETAYTATFTGTDLTNITGVKFYSWDTGSAAADPNVFITDLSPIDSTHFTATIHVPGITKHRLLDVAATTSDGGEGPYLYGGFIIGQFPYPSSGAAGQGVGLSLSAYSDAAGTTVLTSSVIEGQNIWYKVQLIQNNPTVKNFLGGQLVVKFPDGVFHSVAGYGDLPNPVNRDIPEVSPGNMFTAMVPVPYVASSSNKNSQGALVAYAYYGSNLAYSQNSGISEGIGPGNLAASVGISHFLIKSVPTPTLTLTPTPTRKPMPTCKPSPTPTRKLTPTPTRKPMPTCKPSPTPTHKIYSGRNH
jgi:hypothetical protein